MPLVITLHMKIHHKDEEIPQRESQSSYPHLVAGYLHSSDIILHKLLQDLAKQPYLLYILLVYCVQEEIYHI